MGVAVKGLVGGNANVAAAADSDPGWFQPPAFVAGKGLCCKSTTCEGFFMAEISGETSNGFAYEGEYQLPNAGRVHWSVTFRHSGDFAGIRHGCVHGMQDVHSTELEDSVKRDIESAWTLSR